MNQLAPQPLKGIRIADLTWLLASAGASTILASLGAEVIRAEWPERLDFTRFSQVAQGGSGAESTGLGKKEFPSRRSEADPRNPNRGGVFNERNPGKYMFTLNMANPEGRELFKRLVAVSDVVMDGFTAPAMGRWGLDYQGLRAIKEDIIYAQMSGYGNSGPYREFVSYGPIAQTTNGMGYLCGLPEPHPPTMWNHSYMDTTPPLYAAMAVMSAIFYRDRTGKGQYIDQAQYQPGLHLTGTSVLDYSANGRHSRRHGNRSPYLPAAPHGIYRCAGDDEWIGIAVFDEGQWQALCRQMDNPAWCKSPEFTSMEGRLQHQDELDVKIEEWTIHQEKYPLMFQLQEAGVPAGAVQSSKDRVETDPQLDVRDFFVHLDHTEMGVRPFTRHFTPKLSLTPAHPGGLTHRGASCVGEDNGYVYHQVLGLTPEEVAAYEKKGVI